MASAHDRMVPNSGGVSPRDTGIWPSMTLPVVPSTEIQSPWWTTVVPTLNEESPMDTDSAPTTAGFPQPRATTAAWLTRPPRAVRIPSAASIPWTSSGDVSLRTRTTFSPRSAAAWASSAVR